MRRPAAPSCRTSWRAASPCSRPTRCSASGDIAGLRRGSVDTVGRRAARRRTCSLGKRIFYNAADPRMSAEGYISCATCHLDGGHDGRVWDFTGRGEGLRNTTDAARPRRHGARQRALDGELRRDPGLRERHPRRLRRHRLHERRRLRRDRDAARPAEGGTLAPTSTRSPPTSPRSARATLPRSPFRNADGSMTAAGAWPAARSSARSAAPAATAAPTLHRQPLGAGTLHDVGTLRTTSGSRLGGPLTGIDTPTLIGVWETAPYFHDGSAATLDACFASPAAT